MCKANFSLIFAVVLATMVVVNAPSANAQEAKTLTELPVALTEPTKDKTAEAVKELGQKVEKLVEQQRAESAAQAKRFEQAEKKATAKAVADKKVVKKPWYITWWLPLLLGFLLICVGIIFLLRRRRDEGQDDGNGPTQAMIAILALVLAGSVYAAPCKVPAGQPFAVTSLSVVSDPSNPDAPRRVMVMPGQTRTFRISGCGFGWDVNQVIVGFTGGPAVSISEIQNDKIVIKVTPDASFGPAYLNLAVRVKGDLIRTPMVLEVQPPEAYSALQAVERHGVGASSRPAPMYDSTARNVATTAARNATVANESAIAAKNATVNLNEKFSSMFGSDGKGGVVGTEVVSLRQDVEALKKFAGTADAELFYKDGGSRIDDLFERVKTLEEKGGGSSVSPGIEEMKAELTKLRADMDAVMGVTVGSFHRGTIGQKAGLASKPEKASKKVKGGSVIRPIQ